MTANSTSNPITAEQMNVAPRPWWRAVIARTRTRLLEYARFDALWTRTLAGLAAILASSALRLRGDQDKAIKLEASIHRANLSGIADKLFESRLGGALAQQPGVMQRHVAQLKSQKSTEVLFNDPVRLLGRRALVIKSATADEKGVLLLDYFFVFPLFARFFDLKRISARYHIVLEPSWSGYYEPDLLCYANQGFPVFVQNYEPRDIAFLDRLDAGLISVPIAANWWVDHRVFRPLEDVSRDADVLLIASWAKFKRHEAFFAALAKLRARGERLRTILCGYRTDLTSNDIFRFAREYGVADQIEMYERLSPPEVNRQLNRVKVNVLWSRREGFNRALIEGFYSGTPGILRSGFNFGYQYPYINPQTGSFATERGLPETLLEMRDRHEQFRTREWVLDNMSPQLATKTLDECIGAYSARTGENWTAGRLSVKITALDQMNYWDESERPSFQDDYAFLRTTLLRT